MNVWGRCWDEELGTMHKSFVTQVPSPLHFILPETHFALLILSSQGVNGTGKVHDLLGKEEKLSVLTPEISSSLGREGITRAEQTRSWIEERSA